mmetsp:Transcript_3825/g.11965  ORF Transcript_3825/g.11965 Transcript_3825/m.11965 type:complete len:123 (+) Transcript_3825:28-396(+)
MPLKAQSPSCLKNGGRGTRNFRWAQTASELLQVIAPMEGEKRGHAALAWRHSPSKTAGDLARGSRKAHCGSLHHQHRRSLHAHMLAIAADLIIVPIASQECAARRSPSLKPLSTRLSCCPGG